VALTSIWAWLVRMGWRTPAVRVAWGASHLWVQTLATSLIQMVAFAFIARLISTTEMGLLTILSLVLAVAQLIAPLSLPSAIIRFVSEELVQGRTHSASGVVYQSTGISMIVSAVMATACFMFSSQLSAAFSAEPTIFQLVAVDILIAAGLTRTLANALVGAQRFREYSFVTIAYTAVRQALIITFLILFHDFSWLVYAWIVSDVVYVLMLIIPVLQTVGPPTFEFSVRRLLRFSLPLIPGDATTFAYSWYDRAVLLPYLSLANLGVYNVALTAFGVLSAIPGGIASALYPAYAEIQSIKGKAGLEDAVRGASRYVSFISIPVVLGLFATAKPALALFAGQQYEFGSTALQLITIFFAPTVLASTFRSLIVVLGRTAADSAATAASVASSLVAALLLLPDFGINGAAASRGVGMLVSFALTLALVRRRMRLSLDLEAFWKSLAASVGMVLVVSLAQYVFYSRLLLPVYIILGTCAYLAGIRLLRAIHANDVQLVKRFLGKRYEWPINLLAKILLTESSADKNA